MRDQAQRDRVKLMLEAPFDPIEPKAPSMEVNAMLRQAHALEYIAYQLGEFVRLKKEEAGRV